MSGLKESAPLDRVATALASARALAPTAAELARAGERERRLPAPLVEALTEADLFRLCVPRAVGGLEAPAAELVEAVEALARGDGSAGWCLAIGATSGLLAGYLPEGAAREIYGSPGAVSGGVFAPKGRALPVEGGFRVTGRWPFASGCEHCDWLMGGCIVEEQGKPRLLDSGGPDVLLALAPASEVRIHDTWHVAGLRGTGSHDIELTDVFVPTERAASLFSDRPVQPGPLYAFPIFGLLALAIAGVSLGVGRGAIDDLSELAGVKTPTGSSRRLADRPTVWAELAESEARLAAARALVFDAIAKAWETAQREDVLGVEQRAALRLAATHAVTAGAEVTAACLRLGGGSAIYDHNPLQRRFRDAHTATQHMLVAPATWELTGRLLLGLPTDTTQL